MQIGGVIIGSVSRAGIKETKNRKTEFDSTCGRKVQRHVLTLIIQISIFGQHVNVVKDEAVELAKV